jgi:conjugative transfer signal peptidase TraF
VPIGRLVRLTKRFVVIRNATLLAAALSIWTFALCGVLGIRINTSPSLPIGFYVTTSGETANLIEFCPAEPFATLSLRRGYRDRGICEDGGAPLLKPVIAKAGDLVDLSARGISVNGVLLANTAPLSTDTRGRPLQSWPFGRYPVAPGAVWVGSSYHSRSFDSRYFGPVHITAIRHRLKPLLTL